MSGESPEGGFLARWSRLKRSAEVSPAPDSPPQPVAEPIPAAEAVEAAEAPPTPVPAACPIPNLPAIDPASLPPIEALTAESDFAAFLRPGVPPLLRQAALRRMWSVDIGIRDYIGSVEYQWDFNAPGGLPHGFASELVGDLRQLLAQAIGQRDEPEPPPDPAGESPPAEPAPPAPGDEATAESPSAEPEPAPEPSPEAVAELPLQPRRRHGGALPV